LLSISGCIFGRGLAVILHTVMVTVANSKICWNSSAL